MEFSLTQEHELLKKTVREFVESEVKPIAKKVDREDYFPRELMVKIAEQGLLGAKIPEDYGGGGLDTIGSCIILEELARGSGSIALSVSVHGGLAAYPILYFGSEDLRREVLPKIANFELIGSYALTEPCCGSDAASIQTRAIRDGDGYVISGSKTYITGATFADFYIVFARTGAQEERAKGITAFYVPKSKRIKVSKIEMLGVRGTGTGEVVFDDVWVPKEYVIGREGEGFKVAMYALNEGRIATSAIALGMSEAAFNEAFEWAKSRVAFGRPIIEHQMIQVMLTDMRTWIDAMRLLTYRAAWLRDMRDPEYVLAASIAKLYAGQKVVEIARLAVQILGGFGYSKESESERIYRDAKLFEIGEGTNEVQRMVIVDYLLGKLKPKVPEK